MLSSFILDQCVVPWPRCQSPCLELRCAVKLCGHFFPLLTFEVVRIVTLRSCVSLEKPCWFVRLSSESFCLLSVLVFVPKC